MTSHESAAPPQDALPVDIEAEMRASYLDYAMSVIVGRALPDVRDGLKPVHRRVLFAMHELGNHHNRAYKKSARVVGDVIGKYHPHGDQAVYDTLVRMAQDFSMGHVLVDGQGNFGSVDGDPPAAMRYTEVRMAKLASQMLADIDKDTVAFAPNYDESLSEPRVFPARFPNLLVNGSAGIAVGMATNIPPHNLGEVIDATIALCRDPSLGVAELMQIVPGPDFPTGGILYGTSPLISAYNEGRGVVQLRARTVFEEMPSGRTRIVVNELPYQVNKASLLEKIADLVRDKRLEGISDMRDESDRDGMRMVIELKRDAVADVVLNQLYSATALQSSFGINMLAIVEGRPQVLSLPELLAHFIKHRRDVVTRRSRFELREAERRFNVVFGLLAAIDAIDRIIAIVRQSPDQKAARTALMAEKLPMSTGFRDLVEELLTADYAEGRMALEQGYAQLNRAQAQAILEMRLARLTGLERDKLAGEARELCETMQYLQAILGSEAKLVAVIIDELEQIKSEYAVPRKTELVRKAREMSLDDLVAKGEMVVTLSHAGYIKRTPVDEYRSQHRGGRGKTGATTRELDFVRTMFVACTHTTLLVFTNKGKVYWMKVYEVPQGSPATKGKAIVNLLSLAEGEEVATILPVPAFNEGQYVVMCTGKYIKKTDLMSFAHPRASGLIALTIEEGDQLIQVGMTDGDQEVLLATRDGMAIRFSESQVRPMGRSARGVRAITLKKAGDAVVGMQILSPDLPELLTLSHNGYGKRTSIDEYRLQARGGTGIINFKVTPRTGPVSGICGVAGGKEVMVVTDRGMMIRVPVDQISSQGRATQGVRVISVRPEEVVASTALVADSEEDDGSSGDGDNNESDNPKGDAVGGGDAASEDAASEKAEPVESVAPEAPGTTEPKE